jgi:dCTP deaminase
MLAVVPMPDLAALRDSGTTSVDLRLGRWFRTFRQSRTSAIDLSSGEATSRDAQVTREYFVPFGEQYLLHPHNFVLGITLQWIRLPPDLSGYITGKSSLGRRGLVIETAAGIHPGFSGCLALELSNVGEVPLALSPGMAICQVFLHEVVGNKTPAKTQFSGRRKPVLGRIKEDPIVHMLKASAAPSTSSAP